MSDKVSNGLKSMLGEPIKLELVQNWHQYYIDAAARGESLELPYAFRVTREFIDAIRKHEEIDGLELVVIAYDRCGVSPHRQTPYHKNHISIALAPVVNGVLKEDLLYDYTDPCRPPCTRLNVFKKKDK